MVNGKMKKEQFKHLRNRIARLQVEAVTAPTNFVKAQVMKELAACRAELEEAKSGGRKHNRKWDDEDE